MHSDIIHELVEVHDDTPAIKDELKQDIKDELIKEEPIDSLKNQPVASVELDRGESIKDGSFDALAGHSVGRTHNETFYPMSKGVTNSSPIDASLIDPLLTNPDIVHKL